MDKDRHLIHDSAFDVYERASYGHGCEIQPITDDKHKKCKIPSSRRSKHRKWIKQTIRFFYLFPQCATWDMDHQPNCFRQPSKRWYPSQRNSIVKMSAFDCGKIHHLNATHSVLGMKNCFKCNPKSILCKNLFFLPLFVPIDCFTWNCVQFTSVDIQLWNVRFRSKRIEIECSLCTYKWSWLLAVCMESIRFHVSRQGVHRWRLESSK